MLNNKGFDCWSENYDKTVKISDEYEEFPFKGYENILETIYKKIIKKPNASVLDIGFGTGNLSSKLYNLGYRIYGQDFSEKMLKIAKNKMPNSDLYLGDFSSALVKPLIQNNYDFIIATYSLHHLDDNKKIEFIKFLINLLNTEGTIFIGDVIFKNRNDMIKYSKIYSNEWDEDEIYFVVDELKKFFPNIIFTSISEYSGIIELKNC